MADVKISALPAASTPLAGTEVLPIVQGGTTDKVSVANLTAGRTVDGAAFTATGTVSGATVTATGTVSGATVTATGTVSGATVSGTTVSGTTVNVGAGTVSAPSISPTGDSNTGIFFPAADTIAFSEGGVEALRLDSSGNATFAGNVTASGNVTSTGMVVPSSSFLRNRIINGDMRIDQRNAGASVVVSSSGNFDVDRWYAVEDTDGTMTMQQSTTAPAGFVNSMVFTTGTADTSLSALQYVVTGQQIEGVNVADLGWGTASAQSVTLSFWVRCSLTGTFGGSVRNSGFTRSYPFSYSISAANTWEYKTVTIPGDTTGTWLTDTGVGIRLAFGLGAGSSFSGTAGSWSGSNFLSTTGAVSVIGTASATWFVTGVQLEVGTVATPFERRQYGQEFALCQRYFARSGSINITNQTAGFVFCTGQGSFPVTMRASPTLAATNTSGLIVSENRDIGLSVGVNAFQGYSTGTISGSAEL